MENFNWLFYKTKTWERAGGDDEFNEKTNYIPLDKCGHTVTIAEPQYCLDEGRPCPGLHHIYTVKYIVDTKDRHQIVLAEDVVLNLIYNEKIDDLELSGYENEYHLFRYDPTSNKTIKYKMIKEKEVEGYHPAI